MEVVVSMGLNPGRPQQLEYMDTAITVTASNNFCLPIHISKICAAYISCPPVGHGQKSGLSCKEIAHHYFRPASVVGAVLKGGQLFASWELTLLVFAI